jgi:hypothetical protein
MDLFEFMNEPGGPAPIVDEPVGVLTAKENPKNHKAHGNHNASENPHGAIDDSVRGDL